MTAKNNGSVRLRLGRDIRAVKTASDQRIGPVEQIGPTPLSGRVAVRAGEQRVACRSASSGASVTHRPFSVTRSGRLAGCASTSGPMGRLLRVRHMRAALRHERICRPSMIVARHAHRLRQALIVDRGFEHHALVELRHHLALDLLPRRLALGIGVAACSASAARRSLSSASEIRMLAVRLLQIDAHPVAGLDAAPDRRPPPPPARR